MKRSCNLKQLHPSNTTYSSEIIATMGINSSHNIQETGSGSCSPRNDDQLRARSSAFVAKKETILPLTIIVTSWFVFRPYLTQYTWEHRGKFGNKDEFSDPSNVLVAVDFACKYSSCTLCKLVAQRGQWPKLLIEAERRSSLSQSIV